MLARNATETALGLNAVFDIFEECEGRIGGTVDKSRNYHGKCRLGTPLRQRWDLTLYLTFLRSAKEGSVVLWTNHRNYHGKCRLGTPLKQRWDLTLYLTFLRSAKEGSVVPWTNHRNYHGKCRLGTPLRQRWDLTLYLTSLSSAKEGSVVPWTNHRNSIMGNAGSDLLMCSGRGPGMDYDQGMGTIPGYYAGGYDNISVWDIVLIGKPINAHSGQNQPDNFDEIFQVLAQLAKYLKEKCLSEHYQQLSFKYFVK